MVRCGIVASIIAQIVVLLLIPSRAFGPRSYQWRSGKRLSVASMQAPHRPEDYASFTVLQLKEELRSRQLRVGGTKKILIDRLLLHESGGLNAPNVETVEMPNAVVANLGVEVPDKFIYITCKANVEKVVKNEVIDKYGFRFAFSRPGLLTFKVDESSNDNVDIDDIVTIFGSCQGCSISSVDASGYNEIVSIAKSLKLKHACDKIRLHVYGRDEGGAKVEHPEYIAKREKRALQIVHGVMCQEGATGAFYSNGDVARDGDVVLDVIFGPSDDTEKLFIGRRIYGMKNRGKIGLFKNYISSPGNIPDIPLPPEAPSRAYLKIEEVWLWCDHWLPRAMLAGDTVLEVGSAPGGTAYSMLQRGLKVVGVDPCPLDRQHAPVVKDNENFIEIKSYLEKLDRKNMPVGVNWLLCDANIPIVDALPYLQSISTIYGPSFKGVFLTCKLNDKILGKPELAVDYLDKLKNKVKSSMGLSVASYKYLNANRQEVLLCGLSKNTANLLNSYSSLK